MGVFDFRGMPVWGGLASVSWGAGLAGGLVSPVGWFRREIGFAGKTDFAGKLVSRYLC